MTEPVDSRSPYAESLVSAEAKRLPIKAAASDIAAAYELDFFREFPTHEFFKPSGKDRTEIWRKAQNNHPQFAQHISVLDNAILGAQHATEIAGVSVHTLFHKFVNPVAREFMANLLTIRLGVHTRPFNAREIVGLAGPEESEKMINNLGANEEEIRLYSTADLMEAYLDGRLPLNGQFPESVSQDSNQDAGV